MGLDGERLMGMNGGAYLGKLLHAPQLGWIGRVDGRDRASSGEFRAIREGLDEVSAIVDRHDRMRLLVRADEKG